MRGNAHAAMSEIPNLVNLPNLGLNRIFVLNTIYAAIHLRTIHLNSF